LLVSDYDRAGASPKVATEGLKRAADRIVTAI
jgi:hypothetical protein